MFGFANFDLIPTDYIYEIIFGFENVPYSDQADEIGYGSHFIIENSGATTIFIVIMLL